MISSSYLTLASFNELLALSVGLNLAYILVNKSQNKKNEFSIFSFIDSLARMLAKRAFEEKTQEQQRARVVVVKLQYYLSTGLLNTNSGIVLNHIARHAQKVLDEIDSLETDIQQHFSDSNCIRTQYMPYLAFDCTIYGIILLFLSALENDWGQSFHVFISILNSGIVLIAICCIFYENNTERIRHRPTIWNQFGCLSLLILVGAFFPNCWVLLSGILWANMTILIALFLSIVSIVVYFLNCSVKCTKEYLICKHQLKNHSSLSEVIVREKELEEFKEEFDAIDKMLATKELDLQINPTADTGTNKS